MKTLEPSEAWEFGREEVELRQMRRDAATSFRENLIWLEETMEFRKGFARIMASKFPEFGKVSSQK